MKGTDFLVGKQETKVQENNDLSPSYFIYNTLTQHQLVRIRHYLASRCRLCCPKHIVGGQTFVQVLQQISEENRFFILQTS